MESKSPTGCAGGTLGRWSFLCPHRIFLVSVLNSKSIILGTMSVHKNASRDALQGARWGTSKFTAGISEPLNQALFQPPDVTRADPAGVVFNSSNKASLRRSLSNII